MFSRYDDDLSEDGYPQFSDGQGADGSGILHSPPVDDLAFDTPRSSSRLSVQAENLKKSSSPGYSELQTQPRKVQYKPYSLKDFKALPDPDEKARRYILFFHLSSPGFLF